jgi:hypothetical protein
MTPDALIVNWRTSFPVTDMWALSIYQRFNVAARDIEEQDYSIDRDLHCWTLDLYFKDQITTGFTLGFALSLKASPNSVSLSSNKLANDLFNDVSFGY